jgi:broad-specificity NMP kinase
MNRIDIVGVGGVGKSTLVKNLKAVRNTKEWLDEQEALGVAAKNASKSVNYPIPVKFLLSILSALGIKFPQIIAAQLMMKMGGEYYKEFLERNPLFLQAIAKGIERPDPNSVKKLSFIHHFVHVLKKLSFTEHFLAKDAWVIWDESLTHKMFAIIPWEESSIDLVKLYCESVPLPDGIIYLRDSPDFITEKIRKRSLSGGTIAAHENMDADALIKLNIAASQLVEVSVDGMKKRGVKILELDAQDENETNVLRTNEFVDSLIESEINFQKKHHEF